MPTSIAGNGTSRKGRLGSVVAAVGAIEGLAREIGTGEVAARGAFMDGLLARAAGWLAIEERALRLEP